MAVVKGSLQLTGSVKGMTFYTRKGSEQVFMRSKGGPSKQRMATGKEFENVRTHQKEWKCCVSFARAVRNAVGATYHLADYNLQPGWTGIGKSLMKLDTIHPTGERRLYLTSYRMALEGYSLNKTYPLTTVLRVLPTVTLQRETLSVTVDFPRINTTTDVLNVQNLPYFRLIVNLGCVSDMQYNPHNLFDTFEPMVELLQGVGHCALTEWTPAESMLPAQSLSVALNEELREYLTENVSLLVSVGIEFGKVGFGGGIVAVKNAGCGKIVLVG